MNGTCSKVHFGSMVKMYFPPTSKSSLDVTVKECSYFVSTLTQFTGPFTN